MPHLLIAGKLHPDGLALLQAAAGVTWDYVEEVSEASYAPLIAKADGLVIRTQPLTAATVALAGRLKVVSRHGVGYDSVDVAALNARGIALTIVGDVNSVSVGEHAMMLMLACAKRVFEADAATRSDWGWRNRLLASELFGKSLLVVGYGRSGRHLARLALGFGMNVSVFDPYLKADPEAPVSRVAALAAGLAGADFVSLHIPRTDGYLIGRAELAAMRPGAILVNTARGGLVDEAALAEALASGQIGGAGFDVFDEEPPKTDGPLFQSPRVVLTPHIAGLTSESAGRMAVQSVQNVFDFLAGTIDSSLIVNGVKPHG